MTKIDSIGMGNHAPEGQPQHLEQFENPNRGIYSDPFSSLKSRVTNFASVANVSYTNVRVSVFRQRVVTIHTARPSSPEGST